MENKVKKFIEENELLKNCSKLLLGVSGGPDSLAMLNLFYDLKSEFDIEIAAAHLDHMFREESEAEANFVENFTTERNINFFRRKVNLPQIISETGDSAEAEARKQRFEFFKKVMKTNNFDLLALAHQRDDQAETVLLNLFRGSGLNGLSGIQPQSQFDGIKVIHPLLKLSREEILNYCNEHELKPRFDSSNEKNIYSRNIIRNKILKIAESEINENVKKVIARNSKLFRSENEFLNKLAVSKYKKLLKKESKNRIIINFAEFKKVDRVLQRRIYRHIYNILNNNLDDLYLNHILEIEKLIASSQSGRGIDLSAELRVEISYSDLIFSKRDFYNQGISDKIKISLKEKNKATDKVFIKSSLKKRKDFSFKEDKLQAAFDYDKLNLPLYIRSRKKGDKFRPLGMDGHKKVKDILIDEKIPKFKREKIPVVVDSRDNILWLAPYKMSDEFKITKETDKVLILKLKYN